MKVSTCLTVEVGSRGGGDGVEAVLFLGVSVSVSVHVPQSGNSFLKR